MSSFVVVIVSQKGNNYKFPSYLFDPENDFNSHKWLRKTRRFNCFEIISLFLLRKLPSQRQESVRENLFRLNSIKILLERYGEFPLHVFSERRIVMAKGASWKQNK